MDEYFLSETYSPISSTVASWSELLVYVEFATLWALSEKFLCWSQINWGLLKAGKRASKIAKVAVKSAHVIFHHAWWGWNPGWECNACCKVSYPSHCFLPPQSIEFLTHMDIAGWLITPLCLVLLTYVHVSLPWTWLELGWVQDIYEAWRLSCTIGVLEGYVQGARSPNH
jgi:hypothetical protein